MLEPEDPEAPVSPGAAALAATDSHPTGYAAASAAAAAASAGDAASSPGEAAAGAAADAAAASINRQTDSGGAAAGTAAGAAAGTAAGAAAAAGGTARNPLQVAAADPGNQAPRTKTTIVGGFKLGERVRSVVALPENSVRNAPSLIRIPAVRSLSDPCCSSCSESGRFAAARAVDAERRRRAHLAAGTQGSPAAACV